MVQGLKAHLPVQGTQAQSLVWEDPTCHRAATPVCCNDPSPHAPEAVLLREAAKREARTPLLEGGPTHRNRRKPVHSHEAQRSCSLNTFIKLIFKKAGLFFKNYETFQDGNSRALNQGWGPGGLPKKQALCEVFIHSFSRQWGFCARCKSYELTNAKAQQIWFAGVLCKQHLQFHVSLMIQCSRYHHLHSHIRKLRLALPYPAESQSPRDASSTYLMTVGHKYEKRHPRGPRKALRYQLDCRYL